MVPVYRTFQLFPLLFLIFSLVARADDTIAEVQQWFEEQFAPIWEDFETLNPEDIRKYWVEEFRDHPIDADSNIWQNSIDRWQQNIDEDTEDGLLGGTLVSSEYAKISDQAVFIRARWRDHGETGPFDEPYCAAYIAGKFGNEWKITNYFTTSCNDE